MGTPWVSFDGKDCSGCKRLNDRGYCEITACIIPCTVRATIPEVKPKSNADRIRAMSDEELATRIKCPKTTPCIHLEDDYPCVNCKLDWLREEVKE